MLDKILKFEESDRSLFIFDTFVNTGQQWLEREDWSGQSAQSSVSDGDRRE